MNLNEVVNTWGAMTHPPVIHKKKSMSIPILAIIGVGIIGFIIYNEIKKQKRSEVSKDHSVLNQS